MAGPMERAQFLVKAGKTDELNSLLQELQRAVGAFKLELQDRGALIDKLRSDADALAQQNRGTADRRYELEKILTYIGENAGNIAPDKMEHDKQVEEARAKEAERLAREAAKVEAAPETVVTDETVVTAAKDIPAQP